MLFWIMGCAGFEPIAVEVEAVGEAPVISWDIGAVHEAAVWACDEDCESGCDEPGYLLFGSSSRVWSAGFDEDRLLGEVAGSEPVLVGPVTYGDETIVGDERHETALPLLAGGRYGVQVTIWEPCKDGSPDCAHTQAAGCSVFDIDP